MKAEDFEWVLGTLSDSYLFGQHTMWKTASCTVKEELPYVVGIDPGKNMGVCVLGGPIIRIWWGTIPDKEWEDAGVEAFEIGKHINRMYAINRSFIEGPAHSKVVSQAGLAYVRFGLYLGLYPDSSPKIIPPNTARKIAFGHGNLRAEKLWPLLNKNAADAVGIALAGAEITLETDRA